MTQHRCALALDPAASDAWLQLGAGDTLDPAKPWNRSYLGRALTLAPDDPGLAGALVIALAKIGDTKASLALAERLSRRQAQAKKPMVDLRGRRSRIAEFPGDPSAHADIAVDYTNLEDYARSIAHAKRIMAIMPDSERTWHFIAHGYRALGDISEFERSMARYALALKATIPIDVQNAARARVGAPQYVSYIGELALQADLYVKAVKLGYLPPRKLIWPVHGHALANTAYMELWRDHIEFIEDAATCAAVLNDPSLPVHDAHWLTFPDGITRLKERAMYEIQREWESRQLPPVIGLDADAMEHGRAILRRFGLGDSDWFVVLHVRDSGFNLSSGRDEVRQVLRNARIETFDPAIKLIAERGGYVFRIGHPSSRPHSAGARFFDMAHSEFSSPHLDVFLCAQARFFLGVTSGPSTVSTSFGVPSVLTNIIPASLGPFRGTDTFITKLLWSAREQRHLTLREMLLPPLQGLFEPSVFRALGIECHDKTPAEILATVREQLDRHDRSYVQASETEILQHRAREIYAVTGNPFIGRFGDAFLSAHKETLGLDA